MNKLQVFTMVGALLTLGATVASATPLQRANNFQVRAERQDARATRLAGTGHIFRAERLRNQANRNELRSDQVLARRATAVDFRAARADRRANFLARTGHYRRAAILRHRAQRMDRRSGEM